MGFRQAKIHRARYLQEQVFLTAIVQNIYRMVRPFARNGPKRKACMQGVIPTGGLEAVYPLVHWMFCLMQAQNNYSGQTV